ncbi:glutamate 5-kinase [Stereum hirsutum FP-91666 SS1]|uniref:glutamate 5-kinase n=1 Tax=Stereum hirsutum (strain FP-91666) TaxID=721885 RepID=UPI000444A90C|nr:glutamate 5-kinase [Stereum hirsutum FP-91666 SS1]EIM82421.1 glutamate 5-kinase [Stereum hirsutum FP-91666 SS1]
MARSRPCTIVIKLGSSSIVHETSHQPLLSILSSVVEVVVRLRSQGHKVVLVSSGAIAVGLQRMSMPSKPKSLSGKQALAAIGQGRLIALWDNLFGQLGQPIAQVLLTRGDISDRTRYLNAVNTFKELLTMGVVPIVNENDTVSVSEIKFGDNDTLSAITSSMIHADYLFLLTDVDGLYTSNPRKDPSAKLIEVVASTAAIRSQVSTETLGSSLGTGGMETKLIASEIATAAGVSTIITSSKNPSNIFSIIQYNQHHRDLHSANSVHGVGAIHEQTPLVTPETTRPPTPTLTHASTPTSHSPSEDLPRPPHTLFLPSPHPLRDLKSWTTHTLTPSGSVIIDRGAYEVLARRESGGRLLAAGVRGVRGIWAGGVGVRVLVRKGEDGSSRSRSERKIIMAGNGDAGEEEGEGRSTPQGLSDGDAVVVDRSPPGVDVVDEDKEEAAAAEGSHRESQREEDVETELIEVGRGLANYNSAQIEKVMGLNSSFLPQLLGYADSEYVVENITIRVPPEGVTL